MTFPNICSPHDSDSLELSLTACHFQTSLAAEKHQSTAIRTAQTIRLSLSCKMTPGHPSTKKRCSLIQRPNENLPTKQRAPRSQKRAGAEMTCQPAGIEHKILPQLFSNDPRSDGGLLVVHPLKRTTVVQGVFELKSSNLPLRSRRTQETAGER